MQRGLIYHGRHLQTQLEMSASTLCTLPYAASQLTNPKLTNQLQVWRQPTLPQSSWLLSVFIVVPNPLALSARPRSKARTSTFQPSLQLSSELPQRTIKGEWLKIPSKSVISVSLMEQAVGTPLERMIVVDWPVKQYRQSGKWGEPGQRRPLFSSLFLVSLSVYEHLKPRAEWPPPRTFVRYWFEDSTLIQRFILFCFVFWLFIFFFASCLGMALQHKSDGFKVRHHYFICHLS